MTEPATAPAAVTLQVWRVPARHVAAAVVASQLTVRQLRRHRDVTFAKVLGTASTAFLPTAVTPRRWATLTCWRTRSTPPVTWFDRHADERASLSLKPLYSRGSWDGRDPFQSPNEPDLTGDDVQILALTRSTLRLTRAARFYRAIPPIAAELQAASGCRVAFGIGEAPIRRQGTVSIWTSAREMREFAYSAPDHRSAIAATPDQRWYAEELFTRFAVIDTSGSIDGVAL